MSNSNIIEEPATGKPASFTRKQKSIVASIGMGSTILALGWVMVANSPSNVLATNAEVRAAYGVDIIDNPNFTGKDMLKVNDEKLAEFCVRPTLKDVEDKKPLDCKVA